MFSLQPFHTLNNDPGTHAGTGNNFIEITLVIEYSNCTSENVTCAKVLCALLCLQTVLVSMSQDKDIYLKKKNQLWVYEEAIVVMIKCVTPPSVQDFIYNMSC